MAAYKPNTGYPLSEYADLVGLTPKAARQAADRGLVVGAFRPHGRAHWRITGAALNAVVQRMHATPRATRRQLKQSERAGLVNLEAAA